MSDYLLRRALSLGVSVPVGKERLCRGRSVLLRPGRVGLRLLVPTGLRHLPITVTPERIGHKAGEFVPTRKRLVPPSSRVTR